MRDLWHNMKWEPKPIVCGLLTRLGLAPALLLLMAYFLPVDDYIKRVIVIRQPFLRCHSGHSGQTVRRPSGPGHANPADHHRSLLPDTALLAHPGVHAGGFPYIDPASGGRYSPFPCRHPGYCSPFNLHSPSGSVNRLQSGATDRLSRPERQGHPAEGKTAPIPLSANHGPEGALPLC